MELKNDIAFKSNSTKHIQNLEQVWNRDKGIQLEEYDGVLYPMSWTTWGWGYSEENLSEVQKKVKKLINEMVLSIDVDQTLKNANGREALTTLFFDKLAPLSRKIFKRELSEKLFKVLTKEMHSPATPGATKSFKEAYQAAQLWCRLGNFEAEKGWSGSYRIIEGKVVGQKRKQKTLGIFKRSDREVMSPEVKNIQKFFFNSVGKPLAGSMEKTMAGQACVAEEAAYLINKYIMAGIKEYLRACPVKPVERELLKNMPSLVPETHVVSFDIPRSSTEEAMTKRGSFQLWIKNQRNEAKDHFNVDKHYYKNFFGTTLNREGAGNNFPPEFFDFLAVSDYLQGNFDRHAENWFVTYNKKEEEITGVVLIDNGWALAPTHPQPYHFQDLHNHLIWKRLPFAKESFTDCGRFVIQYLDRHSNSLKNELQDLYQMHLPDETKSRVTERRLKRMMERLNVMIELTKDPMTTKADLANIHTKAQIEQVLIGRLDLALSGTLEFVPLMTE